MENFKRNIDKQIEHNKGKNLFKTDSVQNMQFISETLNTLENIDTIDTETENILIDYATDKCLEEFCRINQYISFNNTDKVKLRIIYADLFNSIKNKDKTIDQISQNHYLNLKSWIQNSNPYTNDIYSNKGEKLESITCSEYSAKFQLSVLNIDLTEKLEPVLDIGCGKQANLVNYLSDKGIEAFGIDRFAEKSSSIIKADWLEYDYGNLKWGAIISNLGFSNHFYHHHLRNDGNFLEYAKKYMQILNALKVGGKFYYTPSINFIENYLDQKKFKIEYFSVGNYNFGITIIERLE